ncbi:restriction endonuclease subunit S [Bacteroides stercoris]|uniref:restriction endonuclease subunit S n=1 Tax=Bacteroides stercoris TaxID=46506 RepID=UPI00234E11CB|nr:restriction endonuclease subunit S [Bacteroides stercoris]MDC7162034.1 restriction endonuclease subunit S [Bacteroides stercoris]
MVMANNNENKVLNVPHLRFPEFSGEWKEEQLDSIATLSKGIGISKEQLSEDGEPCILYGELYTKYKSEIIKHVESKTDIDSSKLKRSKANDVIIPCSGETAVDIATARCVPFDNILLGGDLNVISLHKYDGAFMSYQLNGKRKYDIARVAQGVSVVHLYGEHLKAIKTYNPSLPEQQKIAELLSLIDERIATQNKIIEDLKKLKSAISERLLKGVKGSTVLLSDICDIVKGKQINGENLSESGNYYVMNGGTELSGYYDDYNVEANTISISEGGNSCGYVQFNTSPFWSGGHCYSIQDITDNVDNLYLYHYLKSKEDAIMKLRIGSGLPNIQKKDLAMFKIKIPAVEQQLKISTFLSSLERKAEIEERIQNALLKEKQYLLHQMFI